MKLRLLLSAFLLPAIFTGNALAQAQKGQTFIGGSLGVNYDGNTGGSTYIPYLEGFTQYSISKTTTVQINPEFGYFISDNWSVSLQPTFSHSSGTETSYYTDYTNVNNNYLYSDKYNLNMIGIGINFRYYWMFTEKVGVFPQFGISDTNNIKQFGYGILGAGANANLVFFPTPDLGINLGFGNLAYNLNYKTHISTFNFGLNNSLMLGLNYYFGKD